jgi:UDP-N-acetylmuramyl pentapeptide phosphotransferase/UDP-N-acetylglucosamine-1-phosphate transferase
MLWMGAIGFIDDYLKKIKKNKDGLSGIFKIIGQVACDRKFFRIHQTIGAASAERFPHLLFPKNSQSLISSFHFVHSF